MKYRSGRGNLTLNLAKEPGLDRALPAVWLLDGLRPPERRMESKNVDSLLAIRSQSTRDLPENDPRPAQDAPVGDTLFTTNITIWL